MASFFAAIFANPIMHKISERAHVVNVPKTAEQLFAIGFQLLFVVVGDIVLQLIQPFEEEVEI
ncbi:hypothetical protein D3C73_911090 [compost metagenome]